MTPTSLLTGKHINVNEQIPNQAVDDTSMGSSMFGADGDIFSSIGPFTRSIAADDHADGAEIGHDYSEGETKSLQEAAASFRATPKAESAVLNEQEEQEVIVLFPLGLRPHIL